MLNEISFLHPWWYGILGSAPLIIIKYLPQLYKTSYSNISLFTHIRKKSKKTLEALIWATAISAGIAITGPQIHKDTIIERILKKDIFVSIDLSGSMDNPLKKVISIPGGGISRPPPENPEYTTTRLVYAKMIAKSVLEEKAKLEEGCSGDRYGLIVFGDKALYASPLSCDINTVIERINYIPDKGPSWGTTLYGTFEKVSDYLEKIERSEKSIIIMITDTEDSSFRKVEERTKYLLDKYNTTLYVIKPPGSTEKTLDNLADISGGEAFVFSSQDEIKEIVKKISEEITSPKKVKDTVKKKINISDYFIFASFAGLLSIIGYKSIKPGEQI